MMETLVKDGVVVDVLVPGPLVPQPGLLLPADIGTVGPMEDKSGRSGLLLPSLVA
jgi:inorganic pyrophosphatase